MMEMRKVKKHHRRSSSSENSDVHKRRKRTATAIDDLPIDLVLDILHRLDLKSATRCKSVSKEWCSVITDPFFARCFVNYYNNNSRPIVDHCPFTLLLQCTNWRTKNGHLLLPLEEEPYFKSLPYIPPMYQEQRHNEFNIQASCHDLFLCSESAVVSDHNTPFFYYVINPITRQWTALPPLPDQYTASVVRHRPRIGFLCNSCDILLHHHHQQLQLSFRVMLIPEFEGMSTEFKVYIFSSDTSKWSESLVSCPALEGFELASFAFPAVPYNGLLFWCSRDGSLVGFLNS